MSIYGSCYMKIYRVVPYANLTYFEMSSSGVLVNIISSCCHPWILVFKYISINSLPLKSSSNSGAPSQEGKNMCSQSSNIKVSRTSVKYQQKTWPTCHKSYNVRVWLFFWLYIIFGYCFRVTCDDKYVMYYYLYPPLSINKEYSIIHKQSWIIHYGNKENIPRGSLQPNTDGGPIIHTS